MFYNINQVFTYYVYRNNFIETKSNLKQEWNNLWLKIYELQDLLIR